MADVKFPAGNPAVNTAHTSRDPSSSATLLLSHSNDTTTNISYMSKGFVLTNIANIIMYNMYKASGKVGIC